MNTKLWAITLFPYLHLHFKRHHKHHTIYRINKFLPWQHGNFLYWYIAKWLLERRRILFQIYVNNCLRPWMDILGCWLRIEGYVTSCYLRLYVINSHEEDPPIRIEMALIHITDFSFLQTLFRKPSWAFSRGFNGSSSFLSSRKYESRHRLKSHPLLFKRKDMAVTKIVIAGRKCNSLSTDFFRRENKDQKQTGYRWEYVCVVYYAE